MEKRAAYEVVIGGQKDKDGTTKGGRKVVLAELHSGEVRQAMELAGKIKAEDARQFDTALHGLRLSIRSIDDVAVKFADLEGTKLDAQFRMRELMVLARAWNSIHLADDEEMDAVGNMKAIAT